MADSHDVGTPVAAADEAAFMGLLEVLREVTLAGAASQTEEEAFDRFLGCISHLEEVDGSGIYLIDPATDALVLHAHRGVSAAFAEAVQVIPYASEKRHLAPDHMLFGHAQELPDQLPELHQLEGHRAMGLICIHDCGREVGALAFVSRCCDAFSPGVRLALEVIAAQLGSVIIRIRSQEALLGAQAQLEERVEHRTRELRAANQSLQAAIEAQNATAIRLDAVLHSAQLMVWVFDRDGGILYHRGRALPTLQLEDDELVGQNIFKVSGSGSQIAGLVRRALDGESVTANLTVGRVTLLVHLHPWLDGEQQSRGVIAVAIDATKLHQAERARAEAEDLLDQERALAMRTDRLRSLGQMAAGIAHELNQPLTGVRGIAEHLVIARERGWPISTERLDDDLRQVIRQVDRMEHVINHVRIFAREAEDETLGECDLNAIVRSALLLLRAQLLRSGVEIELQLEKGLPVIYANPFSVEEVILNLMHNARFAMCAKALSPEEAAVVTLSTYSSLLDGRPSVVLQVRDYGEGIAPEVLPHVFDPFFTTREPDEGSGLGLAISRSIVEGLSGTISIESELGVGTTVTVVLPALRCDPS